MCRILKSEMLKVENDKQFSNAKCYIFIKLRHVNQLSHARYLDIKSKKSGNVSGWELNPQHSAKCFYLSSISQNMF